MPIVATIKGDLVEMTKAGIFSHVAHGCNCFNTMGAGIAKQFAEAFPLLANADKNTDYADPSKLGSWSSYQYFFSAASFATNIYNFYTQYKYGSDEVQTLRYESIRKCFQKFENKYNDDFNWKIHYKLGIPKIGAGLAGGDWEIIEEIINEETPNIRIIVVDYYKDK